MKGKILIVEDEPGIVFALKDFLTTTGFEVQVAVDGKDGLDKFFTFSPDLVLLDIMLPEMEGTEVLKKIREKNKDTHIIVFTNISDLDTMAEIKGIINTTYLLKASTSLSALLVILKKHFDK